MHKMKSLTVPGSLDSLKDIREYVQSAADAFGLEERSTYRLALAVDEVATNIVTYGYGESGATGDIEIRADVSNTSLEIVLEDQSPPFDPLSKQEPHNLDSPLEDRPIGGLGIFLAVRNVDSFRYEFVDGRNRNIFIMHRGSS